MPPLRLPSPRLLIFDLDGTLVDSLRDIADALNDCLDLLGIPARPVDDYRYKVGDGVPALCARAIGTERPELVARLSELVRAAYRAAPLRHTRPYHEVPELVAELRRRGRRLAVLSNKPHELTVQVVNEFWPQSVFDVVRGYTGESSRKPDPSQALEICRMVGVLPQQTWIVGDTPTDIETARRAGLTAIAAGWGFRPASDLVAAQCVIARPSELLRLLD